MKKILIAALAAGAFAPAFADSLRYDGLETRSFLDTVTSNSWSTASTRQAYVSGQNYTNLDTGKSFIAYCVELMTGVPTVGSGGTYYQVSSMTPTTLDALGRLATVAGTIETAVQSAAMQLAVWNTWYDTDKNVLSGRFDSQRFANQTITGAEKLANTWLSQMDSVTSKYDVTMFASSKYQDVVTFNPVAAVPEPSTYALMGLGLIAMAAVRRRKIG